MRRRDFTRIALTVLLLIGLQSATAPADRAAATLRAVHCCAHNCASHDPLPSPARCCQIHAADTSAVPSTPSVPVPHLSTVTFALLVGPAIAGGRAAVTLTAAPRNVGPLFLLAGSLRL